VERLTELLTSERKEKENMVKKEQELNSNIHSMKQQISETEAKCNEANAAEKAQANALTHLQKEVLIQKFSL
jgi:phage shock protein A